MATSYGEHRLARLYNLVYSLEYPILVEGERHYIFTLVNF